MSNLLDEAYGYSDDSPKCGACGKKMLDHPGLRGTCKALMEAQARIKQLEADLKQASELHEWMNPGN